MVSNMFGPMSVLETILRYEYLWIRIRVQGGAYEHLLISMMMAI